MKRFLGKVVIVTGAGSGIGRAAALAFAREGAAVTVADIDEGCGAETVAMIDAAQGRAMFVATDVSQPSSVNAMVEATVGAYGRLDVYFSNAGVSDSLVPCTETSNDLWQRVISINLSGCFYGARAALPHLAKTGGNVVMMSSVAGLGALAGGVTYTASKHGVVGLINQLACEFAPQGVRVNGVAPGGVKTRALVEVSKLVSNVDAAIAANTPLGRLAEPEEIASPVLFLASSEASYITGTLLRVDGGWRSK